MKYSNSNKGKLNLLPLIVLLITVIVMGAGAYGLRYWQTTKKVSEGFRLGELAWQQQNWQEAARQYSYYLQKDGKNIEVLRKYAQANMNIRPRTSDNLKQALNAYRLILRTAPEDAEALKKAAKLLLEGNSAGECELLINDFLKLNKTDKEVHELMAVALSQQNKQAELEKAIETYPDNKLAYYPMLYSTLMQQTKQQQAAELLKKVIAEYPQEVQAYELLARTIYSNPTLFNEKPEKWLNDAISIAPENPLAYIGRARYLIGTRQKELAVADLNKALELSKGNAEYRLQIASLFASINNFSMARTICGEIFDGDKENIEALTSMLNYASMEGNSALMVEIVDAGMEKLSNTLKWDFIPSAIESYAIAKADDKVQKLIDEVQAKNAMPEYVAYWNGLLAHNKEDIDNEVLFFNKAIQLGYNNDKIKVMLAEAYEINGNNSSAVLQYKKILSTSPNNIAIMARLVELYLENNNFTEVQTLLNRMAQIGPDDSRTIYLSIKAALRSADVEKLRNDPAYYNQIMEKISSYKFSIEDQQQFKTLQFQLALTAKKIGDAEALLKEIEKTGITEEQLENLQIALYLGSDKQDMAMELLNKQIARTPNNLELILREVSLLATSSQYDSAHIVLDKALSTFKTGLSVKKLYFAKADLYLLESKEKPELEAKAIDQIKKLLEQAPNDLSALQRILSFASINSDKDITKKYIEQIKSIEGTGGRIWKIELARQRLRSQDIPKTEIQESISQLKENIAASPGDVSSSILLAMLYEKDGQIQLAANLWLESYNQDSLNLDFALSAIRCLLLAGKTTEADDLTTTLLRSYPDNDSLINLDVSRALRNRNAAQAEMILTKLYADGKCSDDQKLTLASIKIAKNDYEGAHALYDELMKNENYAFNVIASKASAYFRQENVEQALALCDTAIAKFKTPEAYLMKARILLESGKKDLVQAQIDLAQAQENITESDYINICLLLTGLENNEKAIKLALELTSKYPDSTQIARIAIQLLLAEDQYKGQGEQLLEKYLAKFPGNLNLLFLKARALYANGSKPELDQATDILKTIVESQPDNIQAWLLYGEIEYSRQQYQKAVDIVFQGLSFNPGNQELLLLKAKAENEFSPELAAATIKTIQSLNTTDANIAIKLASIYAGQDNSTEALKLLQTAETLTQAPDQLEAIKLLRALIQYRAGDKTTTMDYVTGLLTAKPDNLRAFSILLEMFISDQNWTKTSEVIKQWQTKNPDDPESLFEAVRVLVRKRDIPEAKQLVIDVCNMILAASPGNIEALHIKATLDLTGNNIAQAIETYKAILAINPKDTTSINNMAWMLCEEQNKPQEALTLALQGLEYDPSYPDLLDTTGVIYYKLGQYDNAVKMLLKCIDLYNNNSVALAGAYFHLGRTYYKMNNLVQANSYLKKALEYNTAAKSLSEADIAQINEMLQK